MVGACGVGAEPHAPRSARIRRRVSGRCQTAR